MCDNSKFEQLCRICTEEREGISIYGEEGIRNKLEAKIKSYLHIEVSNHLRHILMCVLLMFINCNLTCIEEIKGVLFW